MRLIDKLRDLSKEQILDLFNQADAARSDLGGEKVDIAVTFGVPGGQTTDFEDFLGIECSLTVSVHNKSS